jgi:hypothetical protein
MQNRRAVELRGEPASLHGSRHCLDGLRRRFDQLPRREGRTEISTARVRECRFPGRDEAVLRR